MREFENRCRKELGLLSEIEEANLESRDRCELVWMILQGEAQETIEAEIKERGSKGE